MRQLVPLLSVLVLCVAIPAQERRSRGRTEGAQQQQAQTEVKPEDYARLEGAVYDANTGAPLAKAKVSMDGIGSRSRDRLAVTTDAGGRFLFSKVEPGQYRLSAGRNRYATQSYGAKAPGKSSTPLTVAPGAHIQDITFKLLPAAVLTGRVVDEDGEPAVYVQVQTLKYRYLQGRRELTPTGPAATTNDLGEYRLFGVSPGRYYVAATYRERFSRESMMGMSAVEQDSTYPTVYYPGVVDVSQTAPIVLRAGEERSSVDFSLMRVRAVRVKGKVVTGAGVAAPAGTMVNLMPKGAKSFTGMFRRFNSVDRRTGAFEMKGLQPGSYVLTAMTRRGRERLYARQDIEAGGTNVEGVVLALGPGIKLSGSVELEEEAPAGVTLEDMRVYAQPKNTMIGGGSGTVEADGRFEMDNLAPGAYSIHMFRMPDNSYLKSARLGDRDVLENGIEIQQGSAGGELKLLVSLKGGQVVGAVTGDDDAPAAGATVVLAPEQSKRGREELFKTATTDQYGRFHLTGVAPGAYHVFAFANMEAGAYRDPAFLAQYEDDGEEIKIEESAQEAVELDLIETGDQGG